LSGRYLYVRGEPYYVTTDDPATPADVTRARRAFLRALSRKFPQFQRGMTTGMYIARFADMNQVANADLRGAAHVLPYDLDTYRRAAPVPAPDEDPTNGA
jgi:hypothetical protein